MACEVKYNSAKGGPEQRIASRLRNSGDAQHADHVVQKGSGPTRAVTNIHHSRVQQHGSGDEGAGDINGQKRGVV
jgi:hypothetical protein